MTTLLATPTMLLGISWTQYTLAFLFGMVCLLLILIVLLQKGRGEGLAGAFGGSSGSAFGAKTGDVFTWVTVGLFVAYLLLAVTANYAFTPRTTPPPQPGIAPVGTPTSAPVTPPAQPATPIKVNPGETGPIKINLDPEGNVTTEPPKPAEGADTAKPAEGAGTTPPPAESEGGAKDEGSQDDQ